MSRPVKSLFCDQKFFDYRRDQQDAMEDEISELTSEDLKNSTDSLALLFAGKYTPPTITVNDPIKEDGGETEKDVSNRKELMITDRSTPTYRTYKRIKVRLPFNGDKDCLLLKPGRRDLNPPIYHNLTSNEIIYYEDYLASKDAEEVAEKIQQNINDWVEDVEWYVEQVNNDIQKMESKLEDRAQQAVDKRRDEERTHQQVMEALDADTEPDTEVGYVKPEKKRDITLPSPEDDSSTEVMPDQTFIDILDVIDDLGLNVERSAERVRSLDEESLRDIFLSGINSHYKGLATGETFNRGGKTDILLRYHNENLFVAECKFWQGQSVYTDAVDQLLGNLTVRDSHAALLVFSKNERFRQVCDRVSEATQDHDRYVTELSSFDDHRVYRFTSHSGEPVKIAVQVFNLQ